MRFSIITSADVSRLAGSTSTVQTVARADAYAAWTPRSLGFTAIEGRGVDRGQALVAAARLSAALVKHPAIGLTFEADDSAETLTA
ncbi:hypothetical protein [Sphingomonas sp. GC_Shp_3]|uniref:hypothetical protein n=1 Tax=Sphingomonas sp. GC_Shp_3 TaxID=2937383 RepID=UPI002269B491|nr:hypothetical protein [Sphingomonas sp. GC_Shp_3]